MVDERLHTRRQFRTRRKGDLPIGRDPRAGWQTIQRLSGNFDRFAHLPHADEIALVNVTTRAGRNDKVVLVVATVRSRLAQIQISTGSAEIRTSDRVLDR